MVNTNKIFLQNYVLVLLSVPPQRLCKSKGVGCGLRMSSNFDAGCIEASWKVKITSKWFGIFSSAALQSCLAKSKKLKSQQFEFSSILDFLKYYYHIKYQHELYCIKSVK